MIEELRAQEKRQQFESERQEGADEVRKRLFMAYGNPQGISLQANADYSPGEPNHRFTIRFNQTYTAPEVQMIFDALRDAGFLHPGDA